MTGTVITSQDGETLDGVLWRAAGLAAEALGTVLAANPGLAAAGPVLPAGTAITLPDLPRAGEPPVLDIVQLWN